MVAAQFLQTADLLPEPMLLLSADGVIEAANHAFCAHFENSQSGIAGTRLDALALEPGDEIAAYLKACRRSGQLVLGALTFARNGQSERYRADGVGYRDGEAGAARRVMLRLKPSREATAAFLTLTDQVNQLNAQMTRREHVEDALRRQTETLEVTLASIGDAVLVTDASGRVSFLNPVAERLTGWPASEAKGLHLREVFHIINEQTRQPVEDPVLKVLQTRGVVGLANHTVLIDRNGREVPIDDSAAPIHLPGGELFGTVLIFRDITERRRADHARAWLASIIESSDDAIVSKRLDGLITSWNQGATRIFGYTADEIVGKPITTIIPPELHAEERSILARLRHGERIEHFDTVRVAKDGRLLQISLTVSPIRDSHGEIVGASKIARDITERKRLEESLRESARRKDEFLATLAHELRNPLAPIRNSVELLARSELPPRAEAAREIIDRQLRHMTHLVDDLLDVSRITAGRVRLRIEPLDLKAVLAQAIEASQPGLTAQRHTLTLSAPDEPLYVAGDRVRLPQVFVNILSNAIKYTPEDGRINVDMRREADCVVIRVRDTGIGIPGNMLNYIFDLFAQVDRSYDRMGGGLGIGLTLARRLVELHEGSIEARSEGADKGSEFVVRLPSSPEGPTATAALPKRTRGSSTSRHKVLIADDNRDAAESLGMLVQMMGHEVRVAYDGLEALAAAEEFKPDVIFLDIGMPHLNGYDVAKRITPRPWAANTLLVALTGWGQEADRQRASSAGFHRHLTKPVELEVLEEVLS
jgi:PAS domain S-box-containing protein